jgi:N-acetylglutamate synthase-like GNAT family acetyltransferase
MYIPIQQPLMMESVAVRPGADPIQAATALRELLKATVMQAHVKGAGEIYFLSNEDTIQTFAAKHAFTKLPFSVYRVKLSDLEKES